MQIFQNKNLVENRESSLTFNYLSVCLDMRSKPSNARKHQTTIWRVWLLRWKVHWETWANM